MKRKFVGIILFVLLVSPRSGFAYKIGAVDLKVFGVTKNVYDDNITSASKSSKKSDFYNTSGITLTAALEGKHRLLGIKSSIMRQSFRRYRSFNNTSYDVSANFTQELSRFDRFKLSNTFSRSDETSSFDDQFGGTSGRYRTDRNTFNANYSRELTQRLSTIIDYVLQTYTYSRADLTESNLNRVSGEVDYSITSKTVVLAYIEYFKRKFKGAQSSSTRRVSGGIRQYLTNQFYLDSRAGIDFVTGFDKAHTTGTFMQHTLTQELDKNSALTLTYLKENSTTSFERDIFKSERLSLSLTRQLYERLGLRISAFAGKGTYSGSGTKDTLKGANFGLSYALFHNTKADIAYNFSQTKSNVDSREKVKNSVSLGATVEF